MLDLNADLLPPPPDPPVLGLSVDVGLGKTRAWRERVAPALVGTGFAGVLAVPRHRLGDEIEKDLAEAGFSAQVYRGRAAADPEHAGEKMCRELDRAMLIMDTLGAVTPHACKYKDSVCEFYHACGYQRQQQQRPDIWIVPHQLLFRDRPNFIPEPDSLTIDEAFWSAALHGVDKPYKLWLFEIGEHREVTFSRIVGSVVDPGATADLMAVSRAVHRALEREKRGRLRRAAITDAGVTPPDLRDAYRLEWRRKLDTEVRPGMPLPQVRAICTKIAAHNQAVARLARFWELLFRTIEAPDGRSPWLDLRQADLPGGGAALAIFMGWRDDIHESWAAPTLIMDATMPVEIVQQFFPNLSTPNRIAAPMPYTRIRQITDRAMSADMLIPSELAGERTNATRRANVERIKRFLRVRADDVRPGAVLVVCQLGLEMALISGELPSNVQVRHFNDIAGENAWNEVALVVVIGRTEPSPGTVERSARVLFGAELRDIEPDEKGNVRYPLVTRGIRLRDGSGVAVKAPCHPDPRTETVRWAICEAGLVQSIGRGRGVNRTAANPLQIDILTNAAMPIEVDEVTTWVRIQPGMAQIMRAAGAVPLSYGDMATCYPDLFPSREAAKKTIAREAQNWGQTPIEDYLIGVCPQFSAQSYRRKGTRGPAGTLLFDPAMIDPGTWLTERLGGVMLVPSPGSEAGSAELDPASKKWNFIEHSIRDANPIARTPVKAFLIRCSFAAAPAEKTSSPRS